MITFFKAVHVCIEKWSTQGLFFASTYNYKLPQIQPNKLL